jgi:hypothetical protein
MKKLIALALVGLTAGLLGIAALAAAFGHAQDNSEGDVSDVPAHLLPIYRAAAATCPGLPWQVLTAVGFIESHHGQGHVDPATGQVVPPIYGPPLNGRNGTARIPDSNFPDGWARAMGPMQFIPSTWASWGRLAPGRPPATRPDAQNAWDAIYSAAAYLCGAAGRIDDLRTAIYRYNYSDTYVDTVLAKARQYGYGTHRSPGARLAWPLLGPVRSGFGVRTDPFTGAPRMHYGIDISAPMGTPIHPAAPGIVTAAADAGGCGLRISIDHDGGLRTRYCHLSVIRVGPQQQVSETDVIGLVGSTGRSTGPHLHFEVYDHGAVDDPLPYLGAPTD